MHEGETNHIEDKDEDNEDETEDGFESEDHK